MGRTARSDRKAGERGLSELLAEIFIVLLTIALILIIVGAVTGILPGMLQQSALLSATAGVHTTSANDKVISLYHQQGFAVNLNGSVQTAGITPVSFTLTTPTGVLVNVRSSPAIRNEAWRPGEHLYFYQVGGYYFVTDDAAWLDTQGPGIAIPAGSWKVNVVDTRLSLLLHSLPVTV